MSVLSSLETTDLFLELELEDEDGDDGNQKKFVLHVYTVLVPMALLLNSRCFACFALAQPDRVLPTVTGFIQHVYMMSHKSLTTHTHSPPFTLLHL